MPPGWKSQQQQSHLWDSSNSSVSEKAVPVHQSGVSLESASYWGAMQSFLQLPPLSAS